MTAKLLFIVGLYLAVLPLSVKADDCTPFGALGVSRESNHEVTEYSTEFLNCSDQKEQKLFSLRRFQLGRDESQLLVNPQTLKTVILKSSCVACSAMRKADYQNSNYGQWLDGSMSSPYPLQNDGITKGPARSAAVAVTIDMCPSRKGISQKVYDRLLQISADQGQSFPVGVAMTKAWLESYPRSFAWLKTQLLQKRLDIVWINHSATHPYRKNQSLEHNFLLSPGINFTSEVLGTEATLIRAGVTPSIFFRFPGLVSSREQVLTLGNWGLIALGSNAWLAKGERARAGSVILIHGNQNEPAGEELFLNYVESKTADIAWASITELLVLP